MRWRSGDPVSLQTERFVLRSLREEDATERYLAWLRDPEVMRFVNARFGEHDLESIRTFIAGHDDRNAFLLGVFERSTGTHIGNYEVNVSARHGHCHTGVLIGDRAWWGRGTVGEVWTAGLEFLFDQVGVEKVCGQCYGSNRAALFNYQAHGFESEGILRSHVVLEEGRDDVVQFALSKEAWRARGNVAT